MAHQSACLATNLALFYARAKGRVLYWRCPQSIMAQICNILAHRPQHKTNTGYINLKHNEYNIPIIRVIADDNILLKWILKISQAYIYTQ